MTEKDHIQYLHMALFQLGIEASILVVETIIKVEDILREKGGNFDIKDLAALKVGMASRMNELVEEEQSFKLLFEKSLCPRTKNAVKQYFCDLNIENPTKTDFKMMNLKKFALLRGVGKWSVKELGDFIKTI